MSMLGDATSGEMAAGWHAVFFPFPAQGHVAPALRLAKLLHVRGGVHITFVHTERNLRRLIRSGGPATVAGAPGFRFVTVPDGLPPPLSYEDEDDHSPQHIAALLLSLGASVPCLRNLLDDAAADGVPGTCVVSDIECVLRFAKDEACLPAVAFWVMSACSLMAALHLKKLVDKRFVPLKGK